MENSNPAGGSVGGGGGNSNTNPTTATEENPNNHNSVTIADEGADSNAINDNHNDSDSNNQTRSQPPARTPFTNLSQVDADLALARTLQEQERAYMMIRMNGDGIDYGSWEAESYFHEDDGFDDPSEEEYDGTDPDDDDNAEKEQEDDDDDEEEEEEEDAFDVHAHAEDAEDGHSGLELDPSAYSSDEAYARALQDAEEREMAARLLSLAGINDREDEDAEEHDGNSQDAWEEVDPDELSYEELLALGEVVGTESRGLSSDTIASLPSINYKAQSTQDGYSDSCVICRLDYQDGDTLTALSCKHSYHLECINNWLQINKVCPVCSTEVSTPGKS